MKLQHIELENLKISPLNVRKHGQTSGADLIPSIKAMGLIQPLLVRPSCEGFEVVAGQRRLSALQEIAKDGARDAVPCLVMEEGDDARAIEASLTENIARLPMDVIDQFEAFYALTKEGRSIGEIALHFGVTEKLVKQRLAIAGLYEPIRNAFRREEIGGDTLQLLTMATTRQQKEWYKLLRSEDGYAPQGYHLKDWLFGGEHIPVSNALFKIESYGGVIVSDLFGDERYFADPKLFWEHQSRAIAEMIEDYREDGWSDVVLLDVGERWASWEHVDTAKEDGGKVFIRVSSDGEVKAIEGQLSRSEIKKRQKTQSGEEDATPERPELTKAMQNYLDLHRHAAVRVKFLEHQGVALRLCVAQIIAGSALWDVRADPQKANTKPIAASLEDNQAQTRFAEVKADMLEALGIAGGEDNPLVYHMPYYGRSLDVHEVFAKLMTLGDEMVMSILTYVVAETLESGSAMNEGLGCALGVYISDDWKPDDVFFDLLRDKEAINAMLAEIGGDEVAQGNLTATAKVQKQIIRDFMTGQGREHKADWQPRYAEFPMRSYTARGGITAIDSYEAVKDAYSGANAT
jgi:ParB family chromosome partitioning protein